MSYREIGSTLLCGTVIVLQIVRCLITLEPDSDMTAATCVVQAPEDSKSAGQQYVDIVRGLTPSMLSEARDDADISRDLHIYWELNNFVEQERGVARHPRINSQQGARFLGYFEGRTGVVVPDWWASYVVDPAGDGRRDIALAYEGVDAGVEADRGTAEAMQRLGWVTNAGLRNEGDHFVAHVGDNTVRFAKSDLMEADPLPRPEIGQVDIGSRVTVFALFDDSVGDEFPLIGLESGTGKVLWRTKVWAAGWRNMALAGRSGGWWHHVSLKRIKDGICVFGADPTGAYSEAFELDSGKCVFRFSTSYWCMRWSDPTRRNDSGDR